MEERLTVRIPKEMDIELEKLELRVGVNRSEVVRRCLWAVIDFMNPESGVAGNKQGG